MSFPVPMPALPAELSIYTAAETRAAWLAWLGTEDPASSSADPAAPVDAAAVDVIDGAGVQLLLALARSLHERGLALQLRSPSRVLREACAGLGADAQLGLGALP